jgi:Holliday junction DNA helicase RuvA
VIAKLRGRIDELGPDFVVLDVGGVGYLLSAPARILAGLPGVGEPATLFVVTRMREDAIRLYGFAAAEERDWFETLQSVQGVGAKVALALLDVLPPDALLEAAVAEDHKAFARAAGVGPRLAKRLASELKDRLPTAGPALAAASPASAAALAGVAPKGAAGEALSALTNLGYAETEARLAVDGAVKRLGADAPLEALIREGLKALSTARSVA